MFGLTNGEGLRRSIQVDPYSSYRAFDRTVVGRLSGGGRREFAGPKMSDRPQPERAMDDTHPVQAMAELQLVEGRADLGEERVGAARSAQPGGGFDHVEPEQDDVAVTRPRTLDQLPNEMIQHILSFLPLPDLVKAERAFTSSRRLQKAVDVALSRCRELDPDMLLGNSTWRDLELLLPKMPGLRSIWRQEYGRKDSSRSSNRRGIKMEVLYNCCHNLVDIDFHCISFIGTSNAAICRQYPALQRMRIPSRYPAQRMEFLVQNQPNLRVLEITNQYETGKAFLYLPPSMEKLVMNRCNRLVHKNLRGVAKCPRLRELELCGSHLTAHQLAEVIAGCPQLEILSLTRSRSVQSEHMLELTRCVSLRHLDLSRCENVREQDIAAVVAACPQLEHLAVEEMKSSLAMEEMKSPLKPERCFPPGGAAGIRYLDISRNDGATDHTLRQLPALVPGLQTLVMKGCRAMRGTGLASLLLLPDLEVLDIRDTCGVTDFSLKSLEGCQLKELRMKPRSNRCTAQGIARFVLSCPSLTSLNLEERMMYDGGISVDGMISLIQQVSSKPDFTMAIPSSTKELLEKKSADQQRLELIKDRDCYSRYESDSSDDLSLWNEWSRLPDDSYDGCSD